MLAWAEKWRNGMPAERAMVLIGSPGIGKTSSAEALARDMGWGIVEMNASDQRTGDAIRSIALRASYYNTFDSEGNFMNASRGGRKLVVLDEADSLFGNADRGAMPAINDLVKTALQPVILIVNDWYELSRKSSAVKTYTVQIKFRKPTAAAVEKVLRRICEEEGVSIEPEAVSKIAENAAGDLRAAVRDLQSLATGNPRVTLTQASALSGREERSDMYQLMDAIFRKRDPVLAKKVLREADTDPQTVSLWIDENMPYECHTVGDLVRCSERLARADVYLGRVSKRQYYGFWKYANDMMVDGITDAIHSNQVTRDRIRFPTYLTKMSRSKSSRALRNSIAMKIGGITHTSRANVLSDTFPRMRIMAQNDLDMRVMLIREAGLEPEELAFLLGVKMDAKIIKDSYSAAEPPKPEKAETKKKSAKSKEPGELSFSAPEKRPGLPSEAPQEPVETAPGAMPDAEPAKTEPAPAEEPAAPKRQKSLFDF